MQLESRRCEAPGPRIPQARGANRTLALRLLPPVPARPRAGRGTRPCSGPRCPPRPVGPPGHTVESSSLSPGPCLVASGIGIEGGNPTEPSPAPCSPPGASPPNATPLPAANPKSRPRGWGTRRRRPLGLWEHFGGNTRFFLQCGCPLVLFQLPSPLLLPPPRGWAAGEHCARRVSAGSPRPWLCFGGLCVPVPGFAPPLSPQAEPQGPSTAPAPPLYIAPARPPPAGQVACGFVFLLPSRRRLCLRLSLSRTPHCAGPAPVGNQARKVLGPHRGELLLPLAQQEQGRAPRSFPQLPSILFIERVLGWWLLFNSKAFKRGTNGEILPLAWRAATVLMDFFFLKPPWDSEPLLPPAPLRSCRDRHALRSFNS